MDQDAGPEGSTPAAADAHAIALGALHRRRRRRRWLIAVSTIAVSAVVIAGSAVAWSTQASADTLASRIDAWHVEHDRAGCELSVRVVSAVGLQQRAEDVLRAAEHVPDAEALLGERERAAFRERRAELLQVIDDGGFVTDDDRAVARSWQARAAAASDPASFDVLAACLQDAEATRPPPREATTEQVAELERELRALGDPRDFDDARIDRLEAAIAQLEPTAIAAARSRAELPALESMLDLAPQQAIASVRDADSHMRSLLQVVEGAHTAADVLDLVEALAMHVAAGWMAEAWQLEAMGEREAAAARASAALSARDAIDEAAPRPITDRGPSRALPPRPPLSQPPARPEPQQPAPAPALPAPPTVPVPSEPPSAPTPSAPAPSPEPGEPEPPVETPAPSPSLGADPTPAPSPEPERVGT